MLGWPIRCKLPHTAIAGIFLTCTACPSARLVCGLPFLRLARRGPSSVSNELPDNCRFDCDNVDWRLDLDADGEGSLSESNVSSATGLVKSAQSSPSKSFSSALALPPPKQPMFSRPQTIVVTLLECASAESTSLRSGVSRSGTQSLVFLALMAMAPDDSPRPPTCSGVATRRTRDAVQE